MRPRIVIGVPSEITQVEKRAVKDSAYRAKASEVHLVEEAMAAAIGAGMPITEPSGNMIVDIGGGTTDIAVISLAGIVYSKAVRVAGNEMDEAIIHYIKKTYNLLIGERTAEAIKMEVGSAYPLEEKMSMEIKGRHLIEGVPKTITISDEEIREALAETVNVIVDAVRVALERTPPELSADIVDRGIVLTGGGALLKNLDKRLREETGLPLAMAEDPLSSVVLGAGKMLSDFNLLRKISHRLTTEQASRPAARRPGPTPSRLMSMPVLEHRRGGSAVLFVLVVVAQIVLISAQVTSKSGMPVLQAVAFGLVAEVQRGGAGAVDAVSSLWSGYLDLRGMRDENERLASNWPTHRSHCSRSAPWPSAARELDATARPPRPRRARHRGGRGHRRLRHARLPHRDDWQGNQLGPAARHGGALAGRRRRPGHRAQCPRGQGAAAHRPQRRRRRAGGAHPRPGGRDGQRRGLAAARVRARQRRHEGRRHRGHVGNRRHLPQGFRHRPRRHRSSGPAAPTARSASSRPPTSRASRKCWSC